MTSRKDIFGSAGGDACDASFPPGKQRNDTRTQAFHRLVNRTDVRFRYDPGLMSNGGGATSPGSKGEPLNWQMLAIWIVV